MSKELDEIRNYIEYSKRLIKNCDDIDFKLRAFEIIKAKKVNLGLLLYTFKSNIINPLFYYNNHCGYYSPHLPLTQLEYDFLKRVIYE